MTNEEKMQPVPSQTQLERYVETDAEVGERFVRLERAHVMALAQLGAAEREKLVSVYFDGATIWARRSFPGGRAEWVNMGALLGAGDMDDVDANVERAIDALMPDMPSGMRRNLRVVANMCARAGALFSR